MKRIVQKAKKEDFTAYRNPKQRYKRDKDFEVLKIAKDQEEKKCLQAVKAGSRTIILKEVGVSEGTKKKRLKTN